MRALIGTRGVSGFSGKVAVRIFSNFIRPNTLEDIFIIFLIKCYSYLIKLIYFTYIVHELLNVPTGNVQIFYTGNWGKDGNLENEKLFGWILLPYLI